MRFKLDEDLPIDVAQLLIRHGHNARTVYDEALAGAKDEQIGEVCLNEERILVTLDIDFADIRAYPPEQYFGLVVLRLRRPDKAHVLFIINRIIKLIDEEPLQGNLWIVEEDRIRIRGKESR